MRVTMEPNETAVREFINALYENRAKAAIRAAGVQIPYPERSPESEKVANQWAALGAYLEVMGRAIAKRGRVSLDAEAEEPSG